MAMMTGGGDTRRYFRNWKSVGFTALYVPRCTSYKGTLFVQRDIDRLNFADIWISQESQFTFTTLLITFEETWAPYLCNATSPASAKHVTIAQLEMACAIK